MRQARWDWPGSAVGALEARALARPLRPQRPVVHRPRRRSAPAVIRARDAARRTCPGSQPSRDARTAGRHGGLHVHGGEQLAAPAPPQDRHPGRGPRRLPGAPAEDSAPPGPWRTRSGLDQGARRGLSSRPPRRPGGRRTLAPRAAHVSVCRRATLTGADGRSSHRRTVTGSPGRSGETAPGGQAAVPARLVRRGRAVRRGLQERGPLAFEPVGQPPRAHAGSPPARAR